MKKIKILLLFLVFLGAQTSYAQIDLAIGNLNAGYASYNSTTGVISGVYFDALNNGNSAAGAFRIAFFLVDPANFSNIYEVHSISVAGQGGNSLLAYSNITINFNNTIGIPTDNYRLIVSIDEDNVIVETNEQNNALYLTTPGNNLSYTPLAVGINEPSALVSKFSNYPNPATNATTISYQLNSPVKNASIRVYNLTGALMQEFPISNQQNKAALSVADFGSGIYFYSLVVEGEVIATKRLVVSH